MTFHNFLTEIRPLVNASGLELAANVPRNTLNKHYAWADGKSGQACHIKHFPNIVRAVCKSVGSVKINEWQITYDQEGFVFVVSKKIPGREQEPIEADTGIEYVHPEWRELLDDSDFIQFFK